MKLQKRLASRIMKCSPRRIHFEPSKTSEIKDAITKADIRSLVNKGVISKTQKMGISQFRTRKSRKQKRKGRQQSYGSRKGTHNARLPDKEVWINSVRLQRKLLKTLRDKQMLTTKQYRLLYAKSKGGFFRSVRHLKLYLTEQSLIRRE